MYIYIYIYIYIYMCVCVCVCVVEFINFSDIMFMSPTFYVMLPSNDQLAHFTFYTFLLGI
jgi:hypothetical protein